MKVNRVILATTNNPLYYQFWNPISRVYREHFGIIPTLIWIGGVEEANWMSRGFGDVIVQPPNPKYDAGWQAAWAIFWFTKVYPESTFMTMGIDQVLLSDMLLKRVAQFRDDAYVMMVDDAYMPDSNWFQGGTSPTSFHFATGKTMQEVYGFENEFHDEIEKIVASGINPYYDKGYSKWGLDESYASYKLRQYRDAGGRIEGMKRFSQVCSTRIECARVNEVPYDERTARHGGYGDAHLPRPYNDHKAYIDRLLSMIPFYT